MRLRSEFLAALTGGETRRARQIVDEAVAAGTDPRAIYLDVLQPALYEIGARWARADLTVAEEHLATATVESIMASLTARMPSGAPPRGRVVLACSGGELHRVGSRMVADFLEADGWEVLFLGALTPPDALVGLVADRRPDVVAISASLPERLGEVRAACAALRGLDPAPFIVAGGQAFGGDAERARAAGADAYAADAAEVCAVLAR